MNLKTVLASLALGLVAATSNAAPLRYDFSGTCTLSCSRIGLATGGSVSGFMIAGNGFDADNFLSGGELTSFGFTFGTVNISSATHSAFGVLALNADRSINYGAALGGITFQQLFGSGATTGNIGGAAGWTASRPFRLPAGGPGTYTAVPEPATLALLGLGLAGLGFARRRKAA